MKWEWLRRGLISGGILFVVLVAVINLLNLSRFQAPSKPVVRELVYVIPKGTATQVGLGQATNVLPNQIELTLGVQDTLVIRNEDLYPVDVGGALLHPGQAYRQEFTRAGVFELTCSVHLGDNIRVIVNPPPAR